MRSKCLLLALAFTILGAGVLPPPRAMCGPNDRAAEERAVEAGKKKEKQDAVVKRSLRMDEVEIYGDVEKPKTMFVIPRSGLQYSRKDHEKDFTNEILDPLTKEWVEDTQRWRVAVPPP